tara:strand:+ start:8271 stop:9446 length:1176 start_codon:yes stop_codon:yes gene_type:complete
MAAPLNERFCLKGDRKNFTINFRTDHEDRAAYFGKRKINEEIIEDIRERYMMGNQPKKYLYGQYGVGKTHTLFNIKYKLEESPEAEAITDYQVKCCFIDAEFKEKTNYNYLHAQMMEALTLEKIREVIDEYLAKNAGPALEGKLRDDFGDANIARAIRALGYAGEPITLWKWLCGGSLTAAELTSYNLTKNMDTISEMYRVLVGIMRLFVNKGIYYLFLLDEMEGLTNVRNQDCRESFHDAFRRLADDDNSVVGFIVSIYAMQEEDIPDFVFREDFKTRLNKANIHHLEYLAHDDDVRQFLNDLFELVVDDDKKKEREKEGKIPNGMKYFPLTDEAMEELVNLAISAPTASLPRNFISALNEGAVHAARRDSYVIDTQDLTPAQAIFTEGF